MSLVRGPASTFLSGADGCTNIAGEVAVVVASPAVLAGVVAAGVSSPAVAGATFPADLAEVVAVDVTPSAIAGVASPVFGVSICLRFSMLTT